MPKFVVHVVETRTIKQSKVFEAADESAAYDAAEGEDYREWEREEPDSVDCGIDWVEEV